MHVVISLIIGALVGLVAGMGLQPTMQSFTAGIANGASIALSYALLGAFAIAIAHSGLPQAVRAGSGVAGPGQARTSSG